MSFVAEKLGEIISKYGSDCVGVICTGKILNEDAYLLQKFARTVIGTNNIDNCARLCHAASEVALSRMLGFGAVSIWWPDLLETDTVMIVGENPKFSHPVLWNILNKRTFRLIIADSARTLAIKNVDVYIHPKPGTDLVWICGVAKIIYDEGLYDKEFIKNNTIGFENFVKSLDWVTQEYVESVSGVKWEDLRKIANLIAGRKTIFIWGMGLTQHPHGTENVEALVNLALMTGNVGKPGTGVAPLRGQNNVQGVGDMGALPSSLSGHYPITDESARMHFEGIWDTRIPPNPGLSTPEMIHEIAKGNIKALYVIGENLLLSEPQSDFVKWMLQTLDLLVVQDVFMSETAKLAHVILPAAMIGEKEGTVTNAARRIQITEKAVDPPGESKEDWRIVMELANEMGAGWNYKKAEDVWEEVRRAVPIFAGVTYDRLRKSYGLLWPVYSENDQTPRLYTDGFAFPDRRARFMPIKPPKFIIKTTDDYPFLLVTCRLYEHFNTGEMTRRVERLMKISPETFVCMNEEDAKEMGISDGDLVRVTSPYASVIAPVKVKVKNLEVSRGIVVVPTHFFNRYNFNRLIGAEPRDPKSMTPPLKTIPVKVELFKSEVLPAIS